MRAHAHLNLVPKWLRYGVIGGIDLHPKGNVYVCVISEWWCGQHGQSSREGLDEGLDQSQLLSQVRVGV